MLRASVVVAVFGWSSVSVANPASGAAAAPAEAKAPAAKAPAPKPNVIAMTITDLKSSDGQILCTIFKEDGWLKDSVQDSKVKIKDGKATCEFKGLPPGVYGASAVHDEDGDDEMDTNFLGIPKEGYCTSRNAVGKFGPPKWEDAKVQHIGETIQLKSKMLY